MDLTLLYLACFNLLVTSQESNRVHLVVTVLGRRLCHSLAFLEAALGWKVGAGATLSQETCSALHQVRRQLQLLRLLCSSVRTTLFHSDVRCDHPPRTEKLFAGCDSHWLQWMIPFTGTGKHCHITFKWLAKPRLLPAILVGKGLAQFQVPQLQTNVTYLVMNCPSTLAQRAGPGRDRTAGTHYKGLCAVLHVPC